MRIGAMKILCTDIVHDNRQRLWEAALLNGHSERIVLMGFLEELPGVATWRKRGEDVAWEWETRLQQHPWVHLQLLMFWFDYIWSLRWFLDFETLVYHGLSLRILLHMPTLSQGHIWDHGSCCGVVPRNVPRRWTIHVEVLWMEPWALNGPW